MDFTGDQLTRNVIGIKAIFNSTTHNLNEAVCVSFYTYALDKDVNLSGVFSSYR